MDDPVEGIGVSGGQGGEVAVNALLVCYLTGERGDVCDDSGGHGGGTTPDRITEEKPGSRESVGDAYAAAAEGRGEDAEEKTATGERDNDAEVRATKQSSAGDRWWDQRRILWMRMQVGEMERRTRQRNDANGKQTGDDSSDNDSRDEASRVGRRRRRPRGAKKRQERGISCLAGGHTRHFESRRAL